MALVVFFSRTEIILFHPRASGSFTNPAIFASRVRTDARHYHIDPQYLTQINLALACNGMVCACVDSQGEDTHAQ